MSYWKEFTYKSACQKLTTTTIYAYTKVKHVRKQPHWNAISFKEDSVI